LQDDKDDRRNQEDIQDAQPVQALKNKNQVGQQVV
jgi:hypothetical protein